MRSFLGIIVRPARAFAWVGAAFFLLSALCPNASAEVFLTQVQAIELAFPGAEVTRKSHYLTPVQTKQIETAAGSKLARETIGAYEARKDGNVIGTAYFDAHKVRTLPEILMIVITPDHKVSRIEVLSFKEPKDYIPPERWYAQFDAKPLSPELSLNRGIKNMTGATLTARATENAVRRALATHKALYP